VISSFLELPALEGHSSSSKREIDNHLPVAYPREIQISPSQISSLHLFGLVRGAPSLELLPEVPATLEDPEPAVSQWSSRFITANVDTDAVGPSDLLAAARSSDISCLDQIPSLGPIVSRNDRPAWAPSPARPSDLIRKIRLPHHVFFMMTASCHQLLATSLPIVPGRRQPGIVQIVQYIHRPRLRRSVWLIVVKA